MNFQDDVAHGEVLTTLYVRSAQGIVTGLIIAQATTQSLPIAAMSMIEAQCHSSFNFMNEAAPQDGNRSECWMTTPIRVVNNLFLTSNEPLQTLLSDQMYIPPAVQRLTIMGFDLPPILVDAGWNLVEKSKSGTGVDFMSVHTLLSPAEAGARRVPGAPENWSARGCPTRQRSRILYSAPTPGYAAGCQRSYVGLRTSCPRTPRPQQRPLTRLFTARSGRPGATVWATPFIPPYRTGDKSPPSRSRSAETSTRKSMTVRVRNGRVRGPVCTA